MKFYRLFASVVIASMMLATIGAPGAPVAAQEGTVQFDRDALYVPGELIVRYNKGIRSDIAFASATSVAQQLGGQVVGNSGNSSLLSFDENTDVEVLAKQIASQNGVARVEPNYLRWLPEDNPMGNAYSPTSIKFQAADGRTLDVRVEQLKEMRSMRKVNGNTKSVPTWPRESYDQWGWWQVRADIVWSSLTTSPTVCVIDTGVDVRHPDLIASGPTPKVINGYDFVNDDPVPNDDNGHGTHVAGTITAVMNNAKGFSGISNGKVVAVKVLTAQGWGTSWDIAMGIYYCANRTDVKVINMSLGGGAPSSEEFDMLDYAINLKNKLVVAAAGNGSTSYFSFPGAWASGFVCANGSDTFPADCGTNTIDHGILSVGAARPGWSGYFDSNEDGLLWVDTDGDTSEPLDGDPDFWDEHFYPDMCASYFSNFGAWVEIVAPGEDILSTVPVSYPFHDQYYYGTDWDNDGYEWFSGTSMAAPHVAAGAARAWGVNPLYTNSQIEDLLLSTGNSGLLSFAMDPNISVPEDGYFDIGFGGEAPYCWPDATKGPEYDTSNAVYLNVAGAMNRGSLWVGVYDAINGLPLPGTTVKAFVGGSLKDTTKVKSEWDGYVPLLNLPGGSVVDVKINKAGYTNNNVQIAWHTITPGYSEWGPWLEVGVPPNNGRIHAVLNWSPFDVPGDLEFFTWTPNVSGPGFVVGPGDPFYVGGNTGAIFVDQGDLTGIPFARWNRDGGYLDWLGMESISIRAKAGSTTVPYYNLTAGDYYDFLATDVYGPGILNEYVILRVWANGKIIGITEKASSCDTDGMNDSFGDADDEIWWHAGYMHGSTFTATDFCGIGDTWTNDPDGAFPYRTDRDTVGFPERP